VIGAYSCKGKPRPDISTSLNPIVQFSMAITKNPRPLLHFGGYTNNQQLPAINTIFQNFCCDAH